MRRLTPSRCASTASRLVVTCVIAASACRAGEPKSGRRADRAARADSTPHSAPPSVATAADTSLATFWTHFRAAVSARDTAAILALTDRAFATRGEMDSDPWIPRDSAGVVTILDSLLTTDPGIGRESTMLAMVAARSASEVTRDVVAGELRVGSFVFAMRGERWRFVRAYLP